MFFSNFQKNRVFVFCLYLILNVKETTFFMFNHCSGLNVSLFGVFFGFFVFSCASMAFSMHEKLFVWSVLLSLRVLTSINVKIMPYSLFFFEKKLVLSIRGTSLALL